MPRQVQHAGSKLALCGFSHSDRLPSDYLFNFSQMADENEDIRFTEFV